MAPWSIHGHSLNLKECPPNRCIEDVEFHIMTMWIQVYGLSMDMYNPGNAKSIGDSLGACVGVMKSRPFLQVRVDIDVTNSLKEGFVWVNAKGEEKWASLKYERLSEFCYGCGRLGHTSHGCEEEIATSELNMELPRYCPWLVGVRQRAHN